MFTNTGISTCFFPIFAIPLPLLLSFGFEQSICAALDEAKKYAILVTA